MTTKIKTGITVHKTSKTLLWVLLADLDFYNSKSTIVNFQKNERILL